MTIIHIVLFKFLPTTPTHLKTLFLHEIRTLALLKSVKQQRLIVGGPSVSEPLSASQGYEFALLSFHEDSGAVEDYQGSSEHKRVFDNFIKPIRENTIRFDFEVEEEDEYLVGVLPIFGLVGGEGK